MNKKNLATLYLWLENIREIAGTSHDTGKTPLINYVIGNNNKKRKIFEKKQESLEYTEKSRKQPKTALQVRATNNSDLQIK